MTDKKKKPGTAATGTGNKKHIQVKCTPSYAKMQVLKMILRLLASCAFMLPTGAGVLLFADSLTGDAANGDRINTVHVSCRTCSVRHAGR